MSIQRVFYQCARWAAIGGGVLLTTITLILCISLIGRNAFDFTLAGDYELAAVVSGATVALFLPWCQMERSHIMVDFFTAKAHPSLNALLDRLGDALMAFTMIILAWRTALGGLNAFHNQQGTQILGFPEWIPYTFMVIALVLTACIATGQAVGVIHPTPPHQPEEPIV